MKIETEVEGIQFEAGKAQAQKDIADGKFEENVYGESAAFIVGYTEAFEAALIAERAVAGKGEVA